VVRVSPRRGIRELEDLGGGQVDVERSVVRRDGMKDRAAVLTTHGLAVGDGSRVGREVVRTHRIDVGARAAAAAGIGDTRGRVAAGAGTEGEDCDQSKMHIWAPSVGRRFGRSRIEDPR